MYAAIEIAKHVINKCTNDNVPISNMQLQKILYYIQKAFLQCGREAFPDEIEAWQIGPVVPDVYYKYCGFGAISIRMKYAVNISEDDIPTINSVTEMVRALKPWTLVENVHKSGYAWDIVYDDGAGDHKIIPKELIKEKG